MVENISKAMNIPYSETKIKFSILSVMIHRRILGNLIFWQYFS